MQRFLASFLLFALMGTSASARQTTSSKLTVMVNGLKNQSGQVCLTVFASSRGFPNSRERAIQAQCARIKDKQLAITFQNLKAGSYAVAVLHDANEDNNLNLNFLGIPTEGIGFSGNPRIDKGPPKFNDSVVLVVGSDTTIQIQLQYFLGRSR